MYAQEQILDEKSSAEPWSVYSWSKLPIRHQPPYPDQEALDKILDKIEKLPPVVETESIYALKKKLSECADGKRMFVQMGDCAEAFDDCNEEAIKSRFSLYSLCQMLMEKILNKPVTKIGRIAGQYAKPRSSPVEVFNGEEINSFFGDNVNEIKPSKEGRTPNPERLLEGYQWSVATYHTIKQVEEEYDVEEVILECLGKQLRKLTTVDEDSDQYRDIVSLLEEGFDSDKMIEDLFISHEGLLLDYESRLTRPVDEKDPDSPFANLSTHMLWIGERTNKLNEAHLEYFRGITNPIGMKVGPKSSPEDIVKTAKILNPNNEIGKLVFILRMGVKNIEEKLPPLLDEISASGLNIVWAVDPVHGNTYANPDKVKVRNVRDIVKELTEAYRILTEKGQVMAGIHLEAAGDNVTECVDGIDNLTDEDLSTNYTSHCDPRLNFIQSLQVVQEFCLAVNESESSESSDE